MSTVWSVTIYRLENRADGQAKDRAIGHFVLENNHIRIVPSTLSDIPYLHALLNDPVRVPFNDKPSISSQDNPKAFLEALPWVYRGAALRASKPQLVHLP